MAVQEIKYSIKNFKLNLFKNLLKQTLITDNQLMFEFSNDMIKSCAFSETKSFMKYIAIPFKSLIETKEDEGDDLFEEKTKPVENLITKPFNFYVLKGDIFLKNLTVHNSDIVDIEITVEHNDSKNVDKALFVRIFSKSENNSPLVTTFILTTEEMISNKVEDYSLIIKECTTTPDMCEITLLDTQIQDIKRLIKNLHKSAAENTAYLTFSIDIEKKIINVKDSVFSIDFTIANCEKLPKENIVFNILKSDFIMSGNNTLNLYTSDSVAKVIMISEAGGALITCLTSKINAMSDFDSAITDSTIENLSEYGMDDLPF
jgi:hypothetical protein